MIRRIITVLDSTRHLSVLTGFLAFCIFSFQEMLRGVQPFGSVSAQINDQSVQFVPFAAEYRRILLHTTEISSYNWTWAAGGGVPMHGNIATYDGGLLFPLILILFPENQIELAFFFITGLSYALATSFTVLLLRKLHSQLPAWITMLLALGYGLSSWALQDGNYIQMWLSGLYMLPLLAFVALKAIDGKGFLSGVLIVAVTWWSNYYTAYMASIGAGLFLLFMLVVKEMNIRRGLYALLFFVGQGLLGVLVAAVVWLPTLRQVLNGVEQLGAVANWERIDNYLGHFLPWTESLSISPSFATTTFTLLLALIAMSAGTIPTKIRIASTLLISGLVFSFAFPKTVIVWNLFDTPNGNVWRASFVVAFLITVVASFSVKYLNNLTLLDWSLPSFGLIVLFLIAVSDGANRSFKTTFALSIFVFLGLMLFFSFTRSQRMQILSIAVISLFVVLELIGSNAWMLKNRDEKVFSAYPRWDIHANTELTLAETFRKEKNFFAERISLGILETPDTGLSNKGFLLSVPTVAYYSSVMPNGTLLLAEGLGVTSGTSPRNQSFSQDPFANALMGTTKSSLHCDEEQSPGGNVEYCSEYTELRKLSLGPMPFAHVIPESQHAEDMLIDGKADPRKVGGDLFDRRNIVVGAPVYKPAIRVMAGNLSSVPENRMIKNEAMLTGQCPSGTVPTFQGSKFRGELISNQYSRAFYHDVVSLKEAQDAKGNFRWSLHAYSKDGTTKEELEASVRCFDEAEYRTAVEKMSVPKTEIDRYGRVSLEFDSPVSGVLVLKMPVSEGYKCRTSTDEDTQVRSLAGLASLELKHDTNIECGYHPPLFTEGLAVSLISLVIAIGIQLRIRR